MKLPLIFPLKEGGLSWDNPFSSFANFLSHPQSYKTLPFCIIPWSISLIPKWDAALFMNHLVKLIRSSNSYCSIFFLSKHKILETSSWGFFCPKQDYILWLAAIIELPGSKEGRRRFLASKLGWIQAGQWTQSTRPSPETPPGTLCQPFPLEMSKHTRDLYLHPPHTYTIPSCHGGFYFFSFGTP